MSFAGGSKHCFAGVVKSQKLQVHQKATLTVSDGGDPHLNEQLASNSSEGRCAHPLSSPETDFPSCWRHILIRAFLNRLEGTEPAETLINKDPHPGDSPCTHVAESASDAFLLLFPSHIVWLSDRGTGIWYFSVLWIRGFISAKATFPNAVKRYPDRSNLWLTTQGTATTVRKSGAQWSWSHCLPPQSQAERDKCWYSVSQLSPYIRAGILTQEMTSPALGVWVFHAPLN